MYLFVKIIKKTKIYDRISVLFKIILISFVAIIKSFLICFLFVNLLILVNYYIKL